jgi:hypothetical protein
MTAIEPIAKKRYTFALTAGPERFWAFFTLITVMVSLLL